MAYTTGLGYRPTHDTAVTVTAQQKHEKLALVVARC